MKSIGGKTGIEMLEAEQIFVPPRHRAINESSVDALANSIQQIGLQTPLSVRIVAGPMDVNGEEVTDVLCLVAGAHRFAALQRLGIREIPCIILNADDNEAIIWECDENLTRQELTTEDKRKFLRLRKEAWEKMQKESGTPRPTSLKPLSGRGVKGFAEETAAATGLSKRQINRLIAEPTPKSPRAAQPFVAPTPRDDAETVEEQVGALMRAWDRAGPEARRDFLARIDMPVFDKTTAGRAA